MKKSLFFVAAAALVLAGCNNDVTLDENTALVGSNTQKEIGFFPLSHSPKRAAGSEKYNAVNGVEFPRNYDMKVVAYSVPETGDPGNYFGTTTANEAPLFGYISSGDAAGYWGGKTTTDKQYWPLSPATLNFLAVTNNGSPTADVVSETFDTDFAKKVVVTLTDNKPQTAPESKTGQHDLMYAFGRASVTQTGNVLDIPKKVDMTFNHALAWVYFRVKAGNEAAQAISIKDIKLKDANYTGTFQAQVNNYNSRTTALSWDADNTKWTAASALSDNYSPNFSGDYNKDADGTSGNDSKSLIHGTYFGVGDGILVVPTQGLDKNSIGSFDIEYYLNGNLYTYNYTPAIRVFEKGKKYIYDITMTLHEIFVDASVEDWKDGATEYVDIPTFAAGTAGRTFDIPATAGTYSFRVAGFTGDASPVVSGTLTTNITGATVGVSSYSGGVATVRFVVPANAEGAKTGTIILTDTGTGADAANNTTVTVNQAAH